MYAGSKRLPIFQYAVPPAMAAGLGLNGLFYINGKHLCSPCLGVQVVINLSGRGSEYGGS